MARLVLLSGFLGAGKTTTMLSAARVLGARGDRVSVVTNDQAQGLVDSALARRVLPLVDEVPGGCFCCRFEDLEAVIRRLVSDHGADTVLAEAVGSCTDMQATVVRPLRRFYERDLQVAPLTTVVDPARFSALVDDQGDLGYLFRLQLADADVIAVNKTDCSPPDVLDATLARLRADHPGTPVVAMSARTGAGLDDLLALWTSPDHEPHALDLDVDYDRYAAAEAELAWLDQTRRLASARGFDPTAWARAVLAEVSGACASAGRVVGHAKVALETASGLVKGSVTAAGDPPVVDASVDGPVTEAKATLNLRVACPPPTLDALVRDAVAVADEAADVRSTGGAGAAFAPSYPRPTHRMTVGSAAAADSDSAAAD